MTLRRWSLGPCDLCGEPQPLSTSSYWLSRCWEHDDCRADLGLARACAKERGRGALLHPGQSMMIELCNDRLSTIVVYAWIDAWTRASTRKER